MPTGSSRTSPARRAAAFLVLSSAEGHKLNGVDEIDIRVEQQNARVQNADDGVRRFVVNRQAAMFHLSRGGDHFLDRQIVRDAGHLRARPHDFLHGAAVEVDDLQDDFLLRLAERALLIGEFEQFLVFLVRERGLGSDPFRAGRRAAGR